MTTTVRVRGTLISIFNRKETTHFIETFLSFRGRSSCMESLITFNAEFNSFFDVGINAGLFSQATLACISKNWIYFIKLFWLFRTWISVCTHVRWFDMKAFVIFTEKVSRFRPSKIRIIWWKHNSSFQQMNTLAFPQYYNTVFKWILTWKLFLNIPASSPSIVLEFFHRSVW